MIQIIERVCSICSDNYEDFGQKRQICRDCKREYDRNYYKGQSAEQKLAKALKQSIRVNISRQYIWDYLKEHPCEICREDDPVVLEFDHLDRNDKSGLVCEMANFSLERVKKEIIKCRVLCANCHRRHTATQLGWYKGINIDVA